MYKNINDDYILTYKALLLYNKLSKETKMQKKKIYTSIFVVSLILSNICASRLIYIGVKLDGIDITLPGGIILYPITFLCTDVIGEKYGKKESNECVLAGLVCQIFVICISKIFLWLPAVDSSVDIAYQTVFAQSIPIMIGSILSYIISQTWDVYVFHKIRNYFISRDMRFRKHRWIWNNASTLSSQLFDTIVFSVISFGIGLGWLFDPIMRYQLFGLCLGQYVCKIILALLDTPLFYLFTRERYG